MPVTFKSQARVDAARIDECAAALGIQFPADYRTFLVEKNGGVPKPRVFKTDKADFNVEQLFSVEPAAQCDVRFVQIVLRTESFREDFELPREYVAIGDVEDESLLLLTVAGPVTGKVWSWSVSEILDFEADDLIPLADSFTAFLELWGKPSPNAKAQASLRKQFDKLEIAIIEQDWERLAKLLPAIDQSLWTEATGTAHPVFFAIESQKLEPLKGMRSAGVNFQIRNDDGQSPLEAAEAHLASTRDTIAIMENPPPDSEIDPSDYLTQMLVRMAKSPQALEIHRGKLNDQQSVVEFLRGLPVS
jgi:hypothetical protein